MAGAAAGRNGRSFMVRTRQSKYMLFPSTGERELFFDMQADPYEMKDLATDKAVAGELTRHLRLLAQWKKTTEEDDYPLQAGPQAQGRKGKRNQGKR